MAVRTQDEADYYVWQTDGKPVAVHLNLDVVDRLLPEVMRGFGAVPKRGAEVGGVLLGVIEHSGENESGQTIVRIEDFEPVECAYRRGPSYLFTDDDRGAFGAACQRLRPDDSRPAYAVGYFRSHTRDGMSLGPEDLKLLDCCFPSPAHVALLIKPYGTKVSTGGFFVREDGVFPDATPLEFPFRRRELTGEDPPPRRSMIERRPRLRAPQPDYDPAPSYPASEPMPDPGPAYAITLPSKSRLRSSIWIPLSFVFLLFGIAIGLMIALARAPTRPDTDFSLGLAVKQVDENLTVKWDPQAPAIRAAGSGLLEIEEGGLTKPVKLNTALLQSGSIIYHNSSNTVRFRLTVYPGPRLTVTQTAQWTR